MAAIKHQYQGFVEASSLLTSAQGATRFRFPLITAFSCGTKDGECFFEDLDWWGYRCSKRHELVISELVLQYFFK